MGGNNLNQATRQTMFLLTVFQLISLVFCQIDSDNVRAQIEECKMTDSLFSFCNLICSDGDESLHAAELSDELHEQCASCAANSVILEEECLQKIFGDLSYF